MYNSIKPGKVWKDTNGKCIQDHGFSVFYHEKENLLLVRREQGTDEKGRICLALGRAVLCIKGFI